MITSIATKNCVAYILTIVQLKQNTRDFIKWINMLSVKCQVSNMTTSCLGRVFKTHHYTFGVCAAASTTVAAVLGVAGITAAIYYGVRYCRLKKQLAGKK